MRTFVGSMVVMLGLVPMVMADVDSGPKPGSKVKELKVFAAAGAIENKEVDFVSERKDKPTVYMFVHADKFSRAMNQFIKAVDGKLAGDAAGVLVWVNGDVDRMKEYLPRIQKSVQYVNSALTIYTGEGDGPKGWDVNSTAHITVVLVNQGKVIQSYGFESVNTDDAKKVLTELEKATKK